jgi:acyl phosphate:glycerol-3-phosphate acyltransferase
MLGYILVAVAAYLLGSIPTGFLIARARGVDIRATGSGNIGATNVFRVVGKRLGIFVLIMDALKGYATCEVIGRMGWKWFGGGSASAHEFFPMFAGLVAVVGHNYTCWLGFKGGKGIATSGGVYVALAPLAVSIAVGIWIILFVITRYVSLASIAAAVALPTAVWLTTDSVCLGLVTTAVGALAIYKHKSNIQRLVAGTEHRFGDKTEPPKGEVPSGKAATLRQ